MGITSAFYVVQCDLDFSVPSSGDADADVAHRQMLLLLFAMHCPPLPPHLPLLVS